MRLEDDQESPGRYQEQEVEGVERTTFQYTPPVGEPGIPKLLKAFQTRDPIRVLRSWKLKSPLAPKAGLRYDGL